MAPAMDATRWLIAELKARRWLRAGTYPTGATGT